MGNWHTPNLVAGSEIILINLQKWPTQSLHSPPPYPDSRILYSTMAPKEYTAPAEVRAHVTSVIDDRRESIFVDHEMSADEANLVALGYKQEFKREFSVWTSFGVSFSVLGLLPSTASTLFVDTTIQLR